MEFGQTRTIRILSVTIFGFFTRVMVLLAFYRVVAVEHFVILIS